MVVRKSSALRSFDAFGKTVEGLRTRSATGGVITVLASTTAAILFLSQLYLYSQVRIRYSFQVAESSALSKVIPTGDIRFAREEAISDSPYGTPSKGMPRRSRMTKQHIPLRVHVTFPHMNCRDLDYNHDAASLGNGQFAKMHGSDALEMRLPSEAEWRAIFGTSPPGLMRTGCTIQGSLQIPRVGGSFSVHISMDAWRPVAMQFAFSLRDLSNPRGGLPKAAHNVSHYIHDISFGDQFPLTPNPLKGRSHMIDNGTGIALASIVVKLIPTMYKRFMRRKKETMQTSVASHIVQPQTLAAQRASILPGFVLMYDFTPLAVHHVESRENIAIFLSSLVGIVGGVFVTVGLLSSYLINSAAAVYKKLD